MYWKFILVNILLVPPDCRIFTGGTTYETLEDSPGQGELGGESFIDKIWDTFKENWQQENISQDRLGKKDEIALSQEINSNNNGISLDSASGKAQTVNAPSSDSSEVSPEHSRQGLAYAAAGQASPLRQPHEDDKEDRKSRIIEEDDKQFIIIVAVAVCTGFIGLMMAGVCYYKFRKSVKAASDVEYPAYGVTGPLKEKIPSPGDRKLAQSAQMYHYQHQKQQMIAMEKANGDMKHDASEDDSEEDNIEGDYTVYECPGLAPTGEMEVRNPLFRGEDTPVSPGQDITGQPHGQDPSPEQEHQQK